MRPAGFEPATKGFKYSSNFSLAWTISPSGELKKIKTQKPGARISLSAAAGVIVGAHPASL